MFRRSLWTLLQARQITGSQHVVLSALASFAGHRGIFPSHESIAARAGCSVRTVIRSLEQAYALGLVERTRQRVRRGPRVVNGPNRYRLILIDLEQAKVAAAYNLERLKAALARRKQRFLSKCQNGTGDLFQSHNLNAPLSKNEWLAILERVERGLTPQEAGYRNRAKTVF